MKTIFFFPTGKEREKKGRKEKGVRGAHVGARFKPQSRKKKKKEKKRKRSVFSVTAEKEKKKGGGGKGGDPAMV